MRKPKPCCLAKVVLWAHSTTFAKQHGFGLRIVHHKGNQHVNMGRADG